MGFCSDILFVVFLGVGELTGGNGFWSGSAVGALGHKFTYTIAHFSCCHTKNTVTLNYLLKTLNFFAGQNLTFSYKYLASFNKR